LFTVLLPKNSNEGKDMTTLYSYIRFSTKAQAGGNSLQRQMQLAEKYCADNNLHLDTTLKLHDLGISAFTGANATDGNLAAFLSAVDAGAVKPGSYLAIENFDRLSREKFRKAFSLFNSILDRDIVVVTLTDNKVYDKNSDFLDIVYAIMIMQRANEESETKSRRLRTAWAAKHLKAEQHKIPKTSVCPAWLKIENNKFVIIEDEADKVRRIFKLYLNGYGYNSIEKLLIKENSKYYVSNIQKMIANKAVIGTGTRKVFELDNSGRRTKKVKEIVEIENYFPAIISINDFALAQQQRVQRSNGGGGRRSSEFNILTKLCVCPHCGGPMIRINHTSKNHNGGFISLVCKTGKSGATKCGSKGWRLSELEPLILNAVKELDIATIIGDDTQQNTIKEIQSDIAKIENELLDITKQLNNIAEYIASGNVFPALLTKADELSNKEPTLKSQLEQLNQQLILELNKSAAFKSAQDNITLLQNNINDEDTRIKINNELRKLIDNIVIWNEEKFFTINYKSSKVIDRFSDGGMFVSFD